MAELTVKQTGNKIILSKTFDAPQELVFSMFKDPAQLAKWFGPKTWPATIKHFDFQPGGVWHYYMTGPDGTKAWGKATFQEIDEPNYISYVDVFSDEEGNVDSKLPQAVVNVTFEEIDGRTTIRSISEYKTAEEVQRLIEMGMVEGVTDTWDQLERLIAEQAR
ncbi:MAG: Activator of Hsp90 ATPase 1 family protein [Candidatus Saccharibacteria bacterium]|nr:Activator of Hsp90 ATPase 1 family protein [Candidatus Saccharibacteria bacterium]